MAARWIGRQAIFVKKGRNLRVRCRLATDVGILPHLPKGKKYERPMPVQGSTFAVSAENRRGPNGTVALGEKRSRQLDPGASPPDNAGQGKPR